MATRNLSIELGRSRPKVGLSVAVTEPFILYFLLHVYKLMVPICASFTDNVCQMFAGGVRLPASRNSQYRPLQAVSQERSPRQAV